ncbi:unnamed protein product [Clavelina lepadiformis]|uniref:ZP domain-containing protein n=1 Tax=Clavelina lepadiformis TaxID=159417 RepID=A0ABP0GBB5_CLALP
MESGKRSVAIKIVIVLFVCGLTVEGAFEYGNVPTSLFCGNEFIKIDVSHEAILESIKRYNKSLSLNDVVVYSSKLGGSKEHKCVANNITLSSGKIVYRIQIGFPFNACQTAARISSSGWYQNSTKTSVEFKNEIWWESASNNAFLMPVGPWTSKCIYENKTILENAVNPKCCEPLVLESSMGSKFLMMHMWKNQPSDDAMSRPLDPPFIYGLDQIIYVTLHKFEESKSNESTTMSMKDCFLLASFNASLQFSSKAVLIRNGCAVPDLVPKVTKSENGNEIHFRFLAQKLKNEQHFYLHCQVKLCNGSCASECVTDQPLSSSGNDNNVSSSFNKVIATSHLTIGPVFVREVEKETVKTLPSDDNKFLANNKQETPADKSWIIPSLLTVCYIASVLLMGVLCYALARTIGARRRARLQQSKNSFLVLNTGNSTIPMLSREATICKKKDCSWKSANKNKKSVTTNAINAAGYTPFNSPKQSTSLFSPNRGNTK